ncbi:neuromedin-U receptor 1-like isoform X2 [Haliotis cracherodii]
MFLNTSITMNNTSVDGNVTSYLDMDITHVMTVYVYRIIYVVGVIGNTFTAVVWVRSRLKVSPVCYFIALSLVDNLVILTHALETQHSVNIQGLCQLVHIVFLAVQILAILLVLGMSIERYIEICHPMLGGKILTITRTKRVIILLAAVSLLLSTLEGYTWAMDPVSDTCDLRTHLPSRYLWIYGFSVIILFFVTPLLCVIILNVLVIAVLSKARRHSSAYGRSMMKPAKASFNTPFLVVSLYLAISELVYALVHLSYYLGPSDRSTWLHSSPLTGRWRSYDIKSIPLLFADAAALSSYALDLTVFTLSSKTFRKEAVGLIPCRKRKNQVFLSRNLLRRSNA